MKNFKPTVWSTRLLAHLDKNLVYGDIVSKDYEGEIKSFGDTVKINQIGEISVGDYEGSVGEAEELTSEQTVLAIDRKKFFNFKVEDIDAVQANVALLDKAMERAGYSIADEIDKDIAALSEEAGIEASATTVELTIDNTYDTIVDLGVLLDENNVSRSDRFIVLPPFAVGLLSKDPRFTLDTKVLENGIVEGSGISGFEIRQSNNIPVLDGVFTILAGSKGAIAYAGQIAKVESYRLEDSFSDAVKGLYVYGLKTLQPDALVQLAVSKEGL